MQLVLMVVMAAWLGIIQMPATPRSYYVAPAGSRAGDGSTTRPWDLATAVAGAGGRIRPGDTIWVRGGTYRGPFRTSVRGAAGAPVVFRQYPGERAILDGAGSTSSVLYVSGDYSVFWGLELTNSGPERSSATAGSKGRPDVVVNNASHTKYINLIVHDGGGGFYTEPSWVDVEIAGCIVYNNGWQGPDRGHGHGLYLKAFTGPLVVRDNVVFNQYGYGIHAYTNANTGRLINIHIEENIAFNNGTLSNDRANPNILLGGEAYAAGDVVRQNLTYLSPGLPSANVQIGYKAVMNGDVRIDSNYFAGGDPVLEIRFWQAVMATGNSLIGTGTLIKRSQGSAPGHIWRANLETRTSRGGGETKVVVHPNPYEPGRAHIAVYNWGNKPSVQVELAGVLAPGDRYEVRSVQNLFAAPLATGTMKGTTIELPMRGTPPPVPAGLRVSRAPQTAPEFDVFLIRKL